MRPSNLRPEFVEFIPDRLNEGIIYISRRYRTASHLCCCGCKLEVVTPLNAAKWRLTEHSDGAISLRPSIGNWSFPCESHYFVTQNRIRWAPALSRERIAAVQLSDQYDAVRLTRESESNWMVLFHAVWRGAINLIAAIKRMLLRY